MTMYFIESQNGTGSSSTIVFNNIPQTFTHLQIRGIARSVGTSSQLYTRLNSDGGSNYATHYMYTDGSGGVVSGSGGAPTTVNLIGNIPASTDLANLYCSFIVDIADYTNTNKNKVTKSILSLDANGGSVQQLWTASSVWMNTAAVTSVTIVANASFATLSNIQLYGIVSNPIATGA